MKLHMIPLAHHCKSPIAGESWYETMTADPATHAEWIARGLNIGVPLEANGQVVVDYDTGMEAPRDFFRKHRDLCTVIVQTRRGVHFYFSGKTKTRKFPHGDIKGSGYVVAPPSVFLDPETGILHPYTFVKGYEVRNLKPFPEKLFPDLRKEVNVQPILECDTLRRITRARLWLAKRESAVSGQHGHSAMFYTCCALFQKFGLTVEQAWPLILEYNERCMPPFSERELRHKITDASVKFSSVPFINKERVSP